MSVYFRVIARGDGLVFYGRRVYISELVRGEQLFFCGPVYFLWAGVLLVYSGARTRRVYSRCFCGEVYFWLAQERALMRGGAARELRNIHLSTKITDNKI